MPLTRHKIESTHPLAISNLNAWPTNGQADLYGLYVLRDPSYQRTLYVPLFDLRSHASRVPACISYLGELDHV